MIAIALPLMQFWFTTLVARQNPFDILKEEARVICWTVTTIV